MQGGQQGNGSSVITWSTIMQIYIKTGVDNKGNSTQNRIYFLIRNLLYTIFRVLVCASFDDYLFPIHNLFSDFWLRASGLNLLCQTLSSPQGKSYPL